jgi:hypothetical protein
MIDLEREQLHRTYQLCRLGFGILAVALLIACFVSILEVFATFHPHLVSQVFKYEWVKWIDIPIVWGSLIGTTLLWGRWEQVSWQRRSGLLLVMCLVDVGLWFLDRGEALGLRDGELGHRWLRINFGQALGWAEFALAASLSSDFLLHLGIEPARESGKSARSMAATGAVLWMLLFCEQTDWSGGWPLQPMRRPPFPSLLLRHGSVLIWTITLIQVTALVVSATRQSGHALKEMRCEDDDHDLLRSRSDSPKDLDLITAYRDEVH